MNQVRRLLGWPLSPWTVLIPFVGVAAVSLAMTVEEWTWPYQEWIHVSQRFHENLILVAPVAAVAVCYFAGRLHPTGQITSPANAARSGVPVMVRDVGMFAVVCVSGYVLGLIPLVAMAVDRAEAGGPHVLVMLTGLLALVMVVAVAYLVGVLAGTVWVTPVVAVATFVLMQFALIRPSFAPVLPVMHSDLSLGSVESPPLVAYRLVLFTAVTLVAGYLAGRALTRHQRWKVPTPGSISLILVLAVGIAVPVIVQPVKKAVAEERPAVCEDVDGVQVCVHQGHRSQLQPMRTAVQRILAVTGRPEKLRTVQDAAIDPVAHLHSFTTRDDRQIWVSLYQRQSTASLTATALANRLSGWCPQSVGGVPTESDTIAGELSVAILVAAGYHDVFGVVTDESGVESPANPVPTRFDGMSPQQLRNWLHEHTGQVADCTVTGADLP